MLLCHILVTLSKHLNVYELTDKFNSEQMEKWMLEALAKGRAYKYSNNRNNIYLYL